MLNQLDPEKYRFWNLFGTFSFNIYLYLIVITSFPLCFLSRVLCFISLFFALCYFFLVKAKSKRRRILISWLKYKREIVPKSLIVTSIHLSNYRKYVYINSYIYINIYLYQYLSISISIYINIYLYQFLSTYINFYL